MKTSADVTCKDESLSWETWGSLPLSKHSRTPAGTHVAIASEVRKFPYVSPQRTRWGREMRLETEWLGNFLLSSCHLLFYREDAKLGKPTALLSFISKKKLLCEGKMVCPQRMYPPALNPVPTEFQVICAEHPVIWTCVFPACIPGCSCSRCCSPQWDTESDTWGLEY